MLPALDDEFAASFNVAEGGLEQFVKDVRENMDREAEQKVKAEVREQVMNALLASNPLEIPQSLKHQEMHAMQREAMQRMGLEDAEQAPPLENFSAAAEKRVALGLLLRQLIADKGLTVNQAMMRARVRTLRGLRKCGRYGQYVYEQSAGTATDRTNGCGTTGDRLDHR